MWLNEQKDRQKIQESHLCAARASLRVSIQRDSADGSNLPTLQKRTSTNIYPLLITASAFHFPLEQPDIFFKVYAWFLITEKSFLINILKIILSVTYHSFMQHEQLNHLIPH